VIQWLRKRKLEKKLRNQRKEQKRERNKDHFWLPPDFDTGGRNPIFFIFY